MSTITSLALTVILANQDPAEMFAPPKEIAQAEFMLGNWKSKGTGMGMDGNPMEFTGSAKCTKIMGRWIEFNTEDDMPGLGKMTGRYMLTYNAMNKEWEGIWFDSLTGHSMKTTGTLKNNTLNMMSGEVPDMMGGMTQFKIQYTKKSDNHIETKVDMKMEGQFVNMLTHNYKK